VLNGWALADGGNPAEGVDLLREGLKDWLAIDSLTYQTYYLGLLAEVLSKEGQADEGLTIIKEALELVRQTGERFCEPELYRLRGELLLKKSQADEVHSESTQCFKQALSIAREQGAIALELRAAVSLARLEHRQGRRREVHSILEPVCRCFTEGLHTTDYLEALSLLQ
jgi:predicted ATPase